MHIVLTHGLQNARQGATKGLIQLLEYVDSEWQAFHGSQSRTMRSQLVVPAHIQQVIVAGVEYELCKRKREVWFRRTDTGYDGNRFYLSEAVDDQGHSWQLELDRSRGYCYDDLELVRAKRLEVSQTLRNHWISGPRVRD